MYLNKKENDMTHFQNQAKKYIVQPISKLFSAGYK